MITTYKIFDNKLFKITETKEDVDGVIMTYLQSFEIRPLKEEEIEKFKLYASKVLKCYIDYDVDSDTVTIKMPQRTVQKELNALLEKQYQESFELTLKCNDIVFSSNVKNGVYDLDKSSKTLTDGHAYLFVKDTKTNNFYKSTFDIPYIIFQEIRYKILETSKKREEQYILYANIIKNANSLEDVNIDFTSTNEINLIDVILLLEAKTDEELLSEGYLQWDVANLRSYLMNIKQGDLYNIFCPVK